MSSNAAVTLIAYSSRLFQASGHSVRCAILLAYTDLQRLKLPQRFKTLFDQHSRKEFILISKSRRWTVQYANGFFNVVGWKSFVHAHKLSTYHTLVLNPNVNVELHTMVFDANNCKRIYSWY
ncbi:hypothetical protein RHMOL_Rhmol01G0336900 [Rhododendron molle]|uniref:Uncharacterized protein n=1 Tax=Rhododendron molle TaxID=49168 RepID=A0ACC0QAA5_RHOML|nr:hypothetical protein RHMOL_Rhmol01G0336900 [Rhododendron molle]